MVVTPPPAPPLPEELTTLLRRMRLPYLRAAAPEVLATARSQRWDPAGVAVEHERRSVLPNLADPAAEPSGAELIRRKVSELRRAGEHAAADDIETN